MRNYFCIIFLLCNFLIYAQNDFLPVKIFFSNDSIQEGFVSYKTLNSFDKKIVFQLNDRTEKININFNQIDSLVLSDSEFYFFGNVKFDKRSLLLDDEITKYKFYDEPVNYELSSDLLLKRLVGGEKELFVASLNDINLYFVKEQNSNDFKYLEYYKIYNNGIVVLPKFRRQLSKILYIENQSINNYDNLSYNEKELSKVVAAYNKLKGNYIEYKNTSKTGFALSPIFGLKFLNYNISSELIYNGGFKGNKSVFFGGFEVDYLIPSKMSNFSIYTQVSYHNFSIKEESGFKRVNSGVTEINDGIDISSGVLNFDFGAKYYFKDFFSKNSLFVSAKINYQVLTNKEFKYFNSLRSDSTTTTFFEGTMKNNVTFGIGVGYKITKNMVFQTSYCLKRNYSELGAFSSEISDFSISLNYIFLNKQN